MTSLRCNRFYHLVGIFMVFDKNLYRELPNPNSISFYSTFSCLNLGHFTKKKKMSAGHYKWLRNIDSRKHKKLKKNVEELGTKKYH